MAKDTKIIQVMVVDGEPHQLKALVENLSKLKKKLDFDVEFMVTNDKIQFRDVKWLIDELYKLYKLGKEKGVEDDK